MLFFCFLPSPLSFSADLRMVWQNNQQGNTHTVHSHPNRLFNPTWNVQLCCNPSATCINSDLISRVFRWFLVYFPHADQISRKAIFSFILHFVKPLVLLKSRLCTCIHWLLISAILYLRESDASQFSMKHRNQHLQSRWCWWLTTSFILYIRSQHSWWFWREMLGRWCLFTTAAQSWERNGRQVTNEFAVMFVVHPKHSLDYNTQLEKSILRVNARENCTGTCPLRNRRHLNMKTWVRNLSEWIVMPVSQAEWVWKCLFSVCCSIHFLTAFAWLLFLFVTDLFGERALAWRRRHHLILWQ